MKNEYGGSYISIYCIEDLILMVDISQYDMLETAFSQYIKDKVDKLLDLTMITGCSAHVPLSRINLFLINSEDGREKFWEHDYLIEKRKKELYPEYESN